MNNEKSCQMRINLNGVAKSCLERTTDDTRTTLKDLRNKSRSSGIANSHENDIPWDAVASIIAITLTMEIFFFLLFSSSVYLFAASAKSLTLPFYLRRLAFFSAFITRLPVIFLFSLFSVARSYAISSSPLPK